MTSVIQKYVKLGVLNYIDHETPRQYFLWDGIMEDEPGRVHSVVEELCNENMALMKTIKALEKSLEVYEDRVAWYRERVVWGFYEDGTPKFYQGKDGEHELCEPVTAKEVTNYFQAVTVKEHKE